MSQRACFELPEGYTPLPGFLGNPIPEDEGNSEFQKFFDYEPGKCLICGGTITQLDFKDDFICSATCRKALDRTLGYIEPDLGKLKRCPYCGMRVRAGVPPASHCYGTNGMSSWWRTKG